MLQGMTEIENIITAYATFTIKFQNTRKDVGIFFNDNFMRDWSIFEFPPFSHYGGVTYT